MLYRPIRSMATWFGVLAYLASATALGSGWVLCTEPDGRVAAELAGDHDSCLIVPMIACTGEEVGCAEHVECNEQCVCGPCPCEDTAFSVELASLTKRAQLPEWNDGRPDTGLPGLGLPTFRFNDNDRCVALHAKTHFNNGAQIRSLRSVVILI